MEVFRLFLLAFIGLSGRICGSLIELWGRIHVDAAPKLIYKPAHGSAAQRIFLGCPRGFVPGGFCPWLADRKKRGIYGQYSFGQEGSAQDRCPHRNQQVPPFARSHLRT
ncbi:hypothetical protein F9K78_09705 [Brucella pseudintermedia]|nr:hypothetical protein F9K78_09705 [Brucella pseudintermedia]